MAERNNGYHQNGRVPVKIKPAFVKTKSAKRVRKAIAARLAKAAPPASEKRIRVGDDWDGMGHPATMHIPEELLPHAPSADEGLPVLRSLSRRRQAKAQVSEDYVQIQMSIPSAPEIGWLKTLQRLFVWIGAFFDFQRAT